MQNPCELITFQKNIAPGVSVRIEGVPASVRSGKVTRHAFDRPTMDRLYHFLLAARERMANGETDIRFDFSDAGYIETRRSASGAT